MSDRGPLRDRTLILRILVPGLETSLRDKMRDVVAEKDSYLNLPGVTCEPTAARNKTLWSFHCDGATYPAKLVNLPCPIELHKTHDHVIYLKSADVGQMLIVYEDEMALEEADQEFKPIEGLNYHHSGLTPPTRKIVSQRFAKREQRLVPPPRAATQQVEEELLRLMEQLAKESENKKSKRKVPTLTINAAKTLEQVEEVTVDYEPWMDEYGAKPEGIEFDSTDAVAKQHPEIWLSPEAVQKIRDKEMDKTAAPAPAPKAPAQKKKGIASKKNSEPVDNVAEAAALIMSGESNEEDFMQLFDLDGDNDFLNFEGLEEE